MGESNSPSRWVMRGYPKRFPHYHHDQMRLEDPHATSELIPIEDECFLATRFGHGTWGHWLGEIFPLVAVAERMYPGQFRYATTFYGAETAWYGSRVVECFAAYGIQESRLFRLVQNRSYVFSCAYTILRRGQITSSIRMSRQSYAELFALARRANSIEWRFFAVKHGDGTC